MNWRGAKCFLRHGGKIKRPNWAEEHFWVMSEDGFERILCHNGDHAGVHLQQIEADDWEIWRERTKILKCRLDGNMLHIFDEGFENLRESPSVFVPLADRELNEIKEIC